MNNKKKLFVGMAALLIGVTGCNKTGGGTEVPDGTSVISQLIGSSIKGYKLFNFGMPAVDVAKLPECIDEYKLAIWDKPVDSEKLKSDLEAHRAELWRQINEKEKFIKQYDDGSINWKDNAEAYENAKREVERLNNPNILKDETDRLAKAEAEDKNRPQKRESFAPEAISLWSTKAMCNVDFMGEKHLLKPKFENGKLVSVEIIIGEFSNAKYQSLASALAEKYPLDVEVTPEQIAAFNNGTLLEAVTTYANAQIGLYASNPNNAAFLNGMAEDTYTRPEEMVLTVSRHMKLVYADEIHAKKINATATTGKTKADDL